MYRKREWARCAHEHGGVARFRYSDFYAGCKSLILWALNCVSWMPAKSLFLGTGPETDDTV